MHAFFNFDLSVSKVMSRSKHSWCSTEMVDGENDKKGMKICYLNNKFIVSI